jgi:hypothetical protein
MREEMIGVVIDDDRILAGRVIANDKNVTAILEAFYATRPRAAMLASLGTILDLGETPSASKIAGDDGIVIPTCLFETMQQAGIEHFHLYDNGSWTHWHQETIPSEIVTFED